MASELAVVRSRHLHLHLWSHHAHLCAAPDKARHSSSALSLSLSLSFSLCLPLFIPRFNQKRKFSVFCYAEVVHFVREGRAGQHAWEIFEVTHRMLLLLLYLSLALSAVWPHNSLWKSFCGCCVLHKITIQFGLKKHKKLWLEKAEEVKEAGQGEVQELEQEKQEEAGATRCPWGN